MEKGIVVKEGKANSYIDRIDLSYLMPSKRQNTCSLTCAKIK